MSKAMEMIERVRVGEDAEDVIAGRDKGEPKKDDSGGLREDIERFLAKHRSECERGEE